MYSYLRERFKHAVRFRHKRGFGVHSPFMFNLILNVIRDKKKRYTYPEEAEQVRGITYRERKFYRLIYRLINNLDVKYVLCLSKKPENLLLYLSDRSEKMTLVTNKLQQLEEADFIYIGKDARAILQGIVPDFDVTGTNRKRYVIISDIYKNGYNARLWQLSKGRANVSLDMMWYGLLLFDEKLQKGRYNLII